MRDHLARRLGVASLVLSSFGILTNCGPTPQRSMPADTSDNADVREDSAYVRLPADFVDAAFLRQTGFNRDHVRDELYAFGYLDRTALTDLAPEIASSVTELDAAAWARQLHDPRTLAPIPTIEDFDVGAAEPYHDYDALTAELQRLAADHPTLLTLESAGRSTQGRELWIVKVSDDPSLDEAPEPKLLYVANMHGDEVVGRELMIYLIRQLVTEYGRTPRITRLVDNAEIYIMPTMNPDGFELSRRGNSRGVDLNRDFPDFLSDPNDTPAGRAAETQALMRLHQAHHFVMALNFHGGSACFNMPWDTRANSRVQDRFGDDALMRQLARAYADANATMRTSNGGSFDRGVTYGYEWYEIDGGMQDWSIYYRASFHATVELSTVKWPAASSLPRYWQENQEALLAYLESALFGVHLRVIDETGALVAKPSIRVSTLNRDVSYPSAYIHRPALPGEQSATVTAPGFAPATIRVTPSTFDGTYQDIVLRR